MPPGNEDRTERATPKRSAEARERGQVGPRADLNSADVLIGGLLAISIVGPKVVTATANAMTQIFSDISRPHNVISGAGFHGLMMLVAKTVLVTVAPIGGICLFAGVALNVLQIGLRFTPKALQPSFSAINPINGFKNLFSSRTTFNL